MAKSEFTKHVSFPRSKCAFTKSGMLWKMKIREWAWAKVDLNEVADSVGVDSNNPNPVPGRFAKGGKAITATRTKGTKKKLVDFFAEQAGYTLIYGFDGSDEHKVSYNLQVQVLTRRAAKQGTVSLTKLEGKSVAFNAPDAKSYFMDKTHAFKRGSVDPANLFSSVEKGTKHIAISSHGGVVNEADQNDDKKICLFFSGFNATSTRLDISNVETAFKALKPKVAKNAVVWIGGCNIGANETFCQKAADASGCHVVAPYMALVAKKYPRWKIDILDRFCIPKIFVPGNKRSMKVTDFCAKQALFGFAVPV